MYRIHEGRYGVADGPRWSMELIHQPCKEICNGGRVAIVVLMDAVGLWNLHRPCEARSVGSAVVIVNKSIPSDRLADKCIGKRVSPYTLLDLRTSCTVDGTRTDHTIHDGRTLVSSYT